MVEFFFLQAEFVYLHRTLRENSKKFSAHRQSLFLHLNYLQYSQGFSQSNTGDLVKLMLPEFQGDVDLQVGLQGSKTNELSSFWTSEG